MCRQNQVELRIVTIPCIEQVHAPAAFGDDYLSDLPQRHLQEFARTNSIPFLDLLPGLASTRAKRRRISITVLTGTLNNEPPSHGSSAGFVFHQTRAHKRVKANTDKLPLLASSSLPAPPVMTIRWSRTSAQIRSKKRSRTSLSAKGIKAMRLAKALWAKGISLRCCEDFMFFGAGLSSQEPVVESTL